MTLTVVGGKHRVDGRSKRQKLAAILAAEASGVVMAERETGIPESTIRYWMAKPEFAAIRAKTREDLAEEYKVAAHLTIKRLVELAPTMEARDVIFAAEKVTTLLQLLSGAATSRTESREILSDFDDHEIDAVSEWLREQAKERLRADAPAS